MQRNFSAVVFEDKVSKRNAKGFLCPARQGSGWLKGAKGTRRLAAFAMHIVSQFSWISSAMANVPHF